MNRKNFPFLAGRPTKSAPSAGHLNSERAFTLAELIVVLAVLAVFGGLLLPALAATHDRGSRAVCQYNLRQIAVAATQYAAENNDYVFPGAGNHVPVQFQVSQMVASEIGLTTNRPSIWTCPNLPGFPLPPPPYRNQWVIGYQYYGGITNWMNNVGYTPSASPVKLSQSKSYWMLAADTIVQIVQPRSGSFLWYDPSGISGWANLPAHHTADTMVPQGGNEVFCDGSVQWIDIHKMYFLHSWHDGSDGIRYFYFYQDLTGDATWGRYVPQLIRAGVSPASGPF